MKNNLLEKGDVIRIENGMKVYTGIPAMFYYSNRKTSKSPTITDVVVGELYENETNIQPSIEKVAKGIVERFGWEGFEISINDARYFVQSMVKKPERETFTFEIGEFVVTRTERTGGGTAMWNDVYPDGHKVYCKRLKDGKFDDEGDEISFYQTGAFNAMIRDIEPIRRMEVSFV